MEAELSAAVAVICVLLLLAVRWATEPHSRLTRFELRLIVIGQKAELALLEVASNFLKRR